MDPAGTAPVDPARPGPEPAPAPGRGPVAGSERIVALDALRGFALLGILVVNVQSFSMIAAAYMNPTAYGDLTGVHFVVWLVTHVGFDQKFMTIFSLLFGAGIVLMTRRLEERAGRSAAVHYRRMMWLTLFGMLHAYLLWYGDILYYYGVCGMLVYPLRRLPGTALILLGLGSIAAASALWLLSGLSMAYWPADALAEFRADWQPGAAAVAEELGIYRGGWLGQMRHRVPMAFEFETFVFLFWGLWRAAGLMLIGMALFRDGVFDAKRAPRTYLGMVAAGLLLGLPLVLLGAWQNLQGDFDVRYSMFFGQQFNYWGSLPVSLGYVGLVMLAVQRGAWPRLVAALAAVGRLALSNYLLQTLLCTWLFYGHGLGWFGRVERGGQALVVLAIWAVQLTLSQVWLKRFRMGPAEWLWRTLTYGKRPRFLRQAG